MYNSKILVVEDEVIIAECLTIFLETMGYSVVNTVASGEEAIAAATITQPDLVLMDIKLQGEMDGIEASQRISTELKIPVVYLTSYADENTLERAKITNPFGYILKPFKEKELRATIEIALWRHHQEFVADKAISDAETFSCNESKYLSMAAHELRNPLNSIKVAAMLLKTADEEWSEQEKQEYLELINNAAEKMNQLIEDILTWGRADSGKLECNPLALNVVSFCQELVEDLTKRVNEQYEIIFTSFGECPTAYLDQKLLWHILNNLLCNAIKYSPQGGMISLTLSCQDGKICFKVQDQGIGISQEDQKHLFEPFQRGTNVGNITGTGLGLAIAKRSVELHNGEISVKSEIAQGTTFTVTLPLNQ